MIKVSVMYPKQNGTRFDMSYYCDHHIPMVRKLLADSLRGVQVEHGLSGMQPGTSPQYVAMGHLLFDSMDAFFGSFGPNANVITADIPNYTDSQPTIQISDVKL